MSFNSYEFILHATGGTVSWGAFGNRLAGFSSSLARDGRDTTEVDYYHNGWGRGSPMVVAGRYLVGTITVTPLSGLPVIDIVAAHPGHGWMATGFGTPCAGSAAREHWHRLGTQWLDTDGTGIPVPQPTAAGGPDVDKFPVSFSVNGPVDPHTEGIRDPRGAAPSAQVPLQPGNGTGFGIRSDTVPNATGLPTVQPGDVSDYAVPTEAILFQSEPVHPTSLGAPAGTNNQIVEPGVAGLAWGPGPPPAFWVTLPPGGPLRDNIDALSFGEDFFPAGITVGLDPAMTLPDPPAALAVTSWDTRGFGPFKEPIVLDHAEGIGFRFSVDPWAIGFPCSAVDIESGGGDTGSGLGPWTSDGDAAADIFASGLLRRVGGVTVGTHSNTLVHDQHLLGLAPDATPLAPMEDDVDALECVGTATNWVTGAPMLTGSVHQRTTHVFGTVDLPPPGTPMHEPSNATPIFFSVTRSSIGQPGSAVRSQFVNDGGAAGDIFVMAKDPITGEMSNLLFMDESEIGLYAVDASPVGTDSDDYTDDLDALILSVCPEFRVNVAVAIGELMRTDGGPFPWALDAATGARTGGGMTISLLSMIGPIPAGCIQVGFSVTTDAIGLEFTGVDWEAEPFDPPGGGSSAAGDIFYATATGGAANPNYLWFHESDLGLDPGSWINGTSTNLADLADNLDALDSTDSTGTVTAVPVGEAPSESGAPRFARVYPNPAGLGATVRFVLPREGKVRLSVYDVTGRFVAKLVDGKRPVGPQEVGWDGRRANGSRAASGVYFLRLEFEGQVRSTKMVVVD